MNLIEHKERRVIMGIMLVGAFIGALSQTLMTSALPTIMKEFNISADVGQWLTTVYLLIIGIMIPTTAYLINKFSTRKLFVTSMVLFSIGCIIDLISVNFYTLLIGRGLQAMGSGILMPLLQVVILSLYPMEKRGQAMAMQGIIIGFAPAIGPTVSGWLVDSFGWHSIFILLSPIAMIIGFLAYLKLKNAHETIESKLDILSVLLSSLGFGGLLVGFTNQGHYGWKNIITFLPIVVGLISLIIFSIRQLKISMPLLELKVFKNRNFTISTLLVIVVYASMMSSTIILPVYIQSILKYSALHSGLIMMPGAFSMVVLSPVAGKIMDRYGARSLCILGMALLTLGTFSFSFLHEDTSVTYIIVMYCIRMVGITLLLMPLTVWGLQTLSERHIPHGTAISNTLRQMAGAIGSAVFISVMTSATNSVKGNPSINASIHGIDISFIAASMLSVIGFFIAIFFVKEVSNKKAQSKLN